MLRSRVVQILLFVMIVSGVLGHVPAADAAPIQHSSAGSDALELLSLINADRASAGLAPLAWRDDVSVIALGWSAQMASTGTLAHNDLYFSAATKVLIGARARGENVAMNGSMEATHYAFMNSPGHRANILDPRFTAVGIGVVRDLNDTAWVTEDFLQEAGAPAPAPAPAADETPAPAPEPEPAPPAEPAADQTITPASVAAAAPAELPPPAPPTTDAPATTTTPPSTSATAPSAGTVQPALAFGGSEPAPSAPTIPTSAVLIVSALVALDLLGLFRVFARRAAVRVGRRG